MKRLVLIELAVLLTASYAQAQFSFGARAGINITQVSVVDKSAKDLTVKENSEMKPGIQLGVVGEYTFSNGFGIQPSVFFYMHRYELYRIAGTVGALDLIIEHRETSNINYLQIPVNAQYKLGLGKIKLLFQAGPYLGIALNGKQKRESHIIEIIRGNPDDEYLKFFEHPKNDKIIFGTEDRELKRLDYGLGLGAGVQLGNIQTVIGYNKGLVNLSNSSWYSQKNISFSVYLAYLFGN